jgi:hypothetical protein
VTRRWSFWHRRYLELKAREREAYANWRARFPDPEGRQRLDGTRYLLERAEARMKEAAARELAGVPGP